MLQSLSDADQELIAGYVLGDLDEEELRQFEHLSQHNPQVQQEVRSLQLSLQLMPHALPKVPAPAALQQKILDAQTSPAPIAPIAIRRSFPWSRVLAGIAILTALLLSADNFRLRRQLSLAQRPDSEVDRVAVLLQQPNSRLVALEGQGLDAAGTLLFTPGQWQEVIVSLGNLPPLPADQVYRMWLTLANGQTLFCGEFNTDPEGSVFVRLTPPVTPPKGVKATGIFVTVDAETTPPQPTGERVMSGQI